MKGSGASAAAGAWHPSLLEREPAPNRAGSCCQGLLGAVLMLLINSNSSKELVSLREKRLAQAVEGEWEGAA